LRSWEKRQPSFFAQLPATKYLHTSERRDGTPSCKNPQSSPFLQQPCMKNVQISLLRMPPGPPRLISGASVRELSSSLLRTRLHRCARSLGFPTAAAMRGCGLSFGPACASQVAFFLVTASACRSGEGDIFSVHASQNRRILLRMISIWSKALVSIALRICLRVLVGVDAPSFDCASVGLSWAGARSFSSCASYRVCC